MKFHIERQMTGARPYRFSHRGFTLLETMIAVALMLIVSIIVYKGFMSSLQYTSNTVAFEKTSQVAVKNANSAFGAGNANGGSSDEGLYLVGSGSYSQVIRVNTYDVKLTPSLISGNPDYSETTQTAATHRFAFHYVVRPCTKTAGCPGSVRFYNDAATGKVVAKCDKCKVVHDADVN